MQPNHQLQLILSKKSASENEREANARDPQEKYEKTRLKRSPRISFLVGWRLHLCLIEVERESLYR